MINHVPSLENNMKKIIPISITVDKTVQKFPSHSSSCKNNMIEFYDYPFIY